MKRKRFFDIVILIVLGILVIFISRFAVSPVIKTSQILGEEKAKPVFTTEYGIIIDSLLIYKDKIKKNQFLADILLKYNVDYQKIDLLAKKSREVFDVRKIRAGNKYTILCKNDSLKEALFFIYESTATDYVVFDLSDSVHIHKGKKEIDIIRASTTGVISSSLWNAMVENNADPNLANDLSEIYAWTIDFFGIQKGDSYKVIYDKLFVDDNYIGVGRIYSAMFQHTGHDFYAFYFIQDSIGDYFDDEAGSMRRTFLKAPLRFKRISSRFSYNRMHPVLKVRKPHLGVDYAAASGTPVHAVGSGKVTFAHRKGPNGN
ncbi:MAG: metalloendopeptidase, partial [Bacteroidetes bacterium]